MSHPLVKEVEKFSKSKPVVIYMKGTPDFPMCGFSAKAVAVLREAGVEDMASFNLLEDDEMWTALEEYTQWPTSPAIFINGKFVGGCDIITDLYERGELTTMLEGYIPN